ncbi:MAG: Asp-tRNA(Asn)/Glu-tRNA(Gln) amidotransferase GatCAB subunit C [Candidatus Magasanikbacteria bacterium CG10_big_fil_rev_8_21_14_0_10_36_32]|uniref:Aspartyl/glutamyl-tRNA(Asn/Gln) amidotransferase subunit C n=1 Tax=Candidatus Magasanikbacteria bacterium CG10_big_fil_rev_8_21_14_0_10_36_32 TaxID=1974646 RepID=A0A2M6W621_9BACT|nr:MAG: Asp-tRNA(Asn)/Glu-tRNA(Gln) amidotransferase GatCAB subunit C [Candidatus Magasanikbacteria bacterium CG10_big_fil_rev_8_21_14_0_10_36_32]
MSLTNQEIKKIAQLARLELTPEEENRYAETISAVLDYMKILNEVDTENIEPTAQVTGLKNVVRQDEIKKCSANKQLIEQMPKVYANELSVPGVFE